MSQLSTRARLLSFCLALLTPALVLAQDANQTQQELEAVSGAIAEISSWLESASADQSRRETAVQEAELAWSEANSSLQSIQRQVSASETRLLALQDQQQELASQRQQQEQILQQIISASYKGGKSQFLKTLLNQEDPTITPRMLQYTRLFGRYQADQIRDYQQTLSALNSLSEELEQELASLSANQARVAEERSRLGQLREQREQALLALNEDIASRNAELAQLELNRAELQELLDEIARAMEGIRSFEDVPPLADARGELILPLQGELISRYGSSYGGGSLRRQGIIIGASEGSPVRAIHPGYVAFANWLRGSGLLVVIDHGDNYVSLYGGNQALAVEAGQWIDAGTVIATSGRGTDTIGPGLYFELRYQGQAQDPAPWLQGLERR